MPAAGWQFPTRSAVAEKQMTICSVSRRLTILWLIVIAIFSAMPRLQAEDVADAEREATQPAGSLVIIGGAVRFNNHEVWSEVVRLASNAANGATSPSVAVFPTASGVPNATADRLSSALTAAGASPVVIPLAVRNADLDYRVVALDPTWVERVDACTGVFFSGGDQSRIVQALVAEDGRPTPLLDAVWRVYRRGGVIAGTSAGAAIMSRIMFRDAQNVLNCLVNGVQMDRQVGLGLGFMPRDWFIDQHALVRGRFARSLVAMKHANIPYGLGIDENTALVVSPSGQLKIVGYKGAILLDLSQAQSDPQISVFNVKNARLSYLEYGDQLDLHTLSITPSLERQNGKIDIVMAPPPSEPIRPLFTNDILGNTTAIDLMFRLIEGRRAEAFGLAFDGFAAREQSTPGFEFRLYRDADTVAWSTDAFGHDSYTIANIHLDVRPVEINGPLYR